MTGTTNFRLTEDDLAKLDARKEELGATDRTDALRKLIRGPNLSGSHRLSPVNDQTAAYFPAKPGSRLKTDRKPKP